LPNLHPCPTLCHPECRMVLRPTPTNENQRNS
jgi:hypothetical protein